MVVPPQNFINNRPWPNNYSVKNHSSISWNIKRFFIKYCGHKLETMWCMWSKAGMSGEHHRYYKHTKFHQNLIDDPKFLVDFTQNDPYLCLWLQSCSITKSCPLLRLETPLGAGCIRRPKSTYFHFLTFSNNFVDRGGIPSTTTFEDPPVLEMDAGESSSAEIASTGKVGVEGGPLSTKNQWLLFPDLNRQELVMADVLHTQAISTQKIVPVCVCDHEVPTARARW